MYSSISFLATSHSLRQLEIVHGSHPDERAHGAEREVSSKRFACLRQETFIPENPAKAQVQFGPIRTALQGLPELLQRHLAAFCPSSNSVDDLRSTDLEPIEQPDLRG